MVADINLKVFSLVSKSLSIRYDWSEVSAIMNNSYELFLWATYCLIRLRKALLSIAWKRKFNVMRYCYLAGKLPKKVLTLRILIRLLHSIVNWTMTIKWVNASCSTTLYIIAHESTAQAKETWSLVIFKVFKLFTALMSFVSI